MHFRTRRRVVQLVRTVYDSVGKRPVATVVGRMPLRNPRLTPELLAVLTEEEAAQARNWIELTHRNLTAGDEAVARALPASILQAERWFAGTSDPDPATRELAARIVAQWSALRRTLRKQGLVDAAGEAAHRRRATSDDPV